MSEQKTHRFRPPLYHRRGESPAPARVVAQAEVTAEQQGWDAYRKWLTHTTAKPAAAQRIPVDHSIYSWKGYQNWADKVRQSWKADES